MAKRAARARSSRPPSSQPATAAPALRANHLVRAMEGLDEERKKGIIEHVHPLHAQHAGQWQIQLDAFEGAGGFLTGDYLWKFPAEESGEFQERQKQARWHNYAESLVNIYVRHVFRTNLTRKTANKDLEAWWQDVDGARTSIDAYMKRGARLALVAGHVGCLVDKTQEPPVGPSKADERAKVIASHFTAPAILDWRLKAGEIIGVKLLEGRGPESILEEIPTGDDAKQYLIWDREGWARFDAQGQALEASAPGRTVASLVPLAVVRPSPSAVNPFIGQSLLGNANVYLALYNRCSEEDNVLRDQAFSMLTVNVPPEGNVEEAKQHVGRDMGTTRAIVVKGEVGYITADMQAPAQIRENILFLIREIFRVAHVKFSRESLDAESAESIRLQQSELNEMLANLAAELEEAERQIARFWCHWNSTSFEAGEALFQAADVQIAYSREFFVADLMQELEKWAKGIALDLGITFEHEAKKKVVRQLLPEASPDLLKAIDGEIDGQKSAREQRMEDAQARLRLTFGDDPNSGDPSPRPGEGEGGEGRQAA